MDARKDARTGLLMLTGFLFLTAGILQATRFFPLASSPLSSVIALAMLVPGIVLLLLGLLRVKHVGSAILLALATCVLVLVASGLTAFVVPGYRPHVVVEEVTTADVVGASEIVLSVEVQVGSLEIYTTSNRSLLLRVEFYTATRGASFSFSWSFSPAEGVLKAEASAPSAAICIFVADWLPWTVKAKTETGSVTVQVNATFLKDLHVKTSTGSVKMAISALKLASNTTTNATVVAETSLGSVEMAVSTGATVGCLVEARTSLGSLDHEEEGYEVLVERHGELVLRSEGYEGASAYLTISVKTSLGSVDITAERRA